MRFLRHVTGTNTFYICSKTILSISHASCTFVLSGVHQLLVRFIATCPLQSLCILCVTYFDHECLWVLNFDFHHQTAMDDPARIFIIC